MKTNLSSILYVILVSLTCWCAVHTSTAGRDGQNNCNSKRCNFRNELSADPVQPVDESLLKCCACGKATYRMTFIGMWDSQTHPKHFPGQMSSWSSLIGCSHSKNYHIWRLGELASLGVKKVSEMGSVWKLEKEMRQQGKVVNSVIKAPGLWWGVGQSQPTKFRADPQHNLFSVMSRIIPSPDWFVGIDSLNLCHLNCTWKDEESVDLFPVDAGTDDGINFISVNSQSTPQQPITRISTRLHDHPKASFYLPDNDVIRPFARIKIEKMAVSGSCSSAARKSPAPTKAASINCQVSRWSSWTSCSVSCGVGLQTRGRVVLIQPKHHGIECPNLYEHKSCYLRKCQVPSKCILSAWSKWGRCIGTCGVGRKRRTRTILYKPPNITRCPVKTKRRRCRLPPCQGDRRTDKIIDCQMSSWSQWSKCNRPCRGKKRRTRFILRKPKNGGKTCPPTREKRKCNRKKCPKN